MHHEKREIPRVWEVDWALPPGQGGESWEAYGWILATTQELGLADVSIVAGTYESLGRLDRAIGNGEAQALRVQPHRYTVGGLTVHGMARRGFWHVRGPILVAWADDQILTEVEGQRPPAIAAVATWPDDVAIWRSVYQPRRIGQVRPDQEAEFNTVTLDELDPRAARAIRSAAALVNENHAVLSTHEREMIAGALVALRDAKVPVDRVALRATLMAAGRRGRLVDRALQLAERVARGETPRHRHFALR